MRSTRRSHNQRKKATRRHRSYHRGGAGMDYTGLHVLVTGGAGFIGSNLVDSLLEQGAAKVRVLDNFRTGKRENLENARTVGGDRFELMEGDIRNIDTCIEACKDMDVVFHEAALVSVPQSMTEPILNHEINITGTLNMLIAAASTRAEMKTKKHYVKRFVYASSAATYGSLLEIPKRETQTRNYPSPYALSKGVDEDYANQWAAKTELGKGMTCVGLRYFNVYGPRQDPKSPYSGVISIFTDRIKAGEPIKFFGDGMQTRDFVFVKDVVQANLLAGRADLAEGESRVFNVGTGSAITLRDLADIMADIAGKPVTREFANTRPGNIRNSVSSIDLISSELGYSPKYTLKQGLTILFESQA